MTRSSTPPIEYAPMRRVLSIEDAAEHLGVQTRTIRRWIADGTLTAYRVGPKLIRIDGASIDALLQPVPTADVGGDAA